MARHLKADVMRAAVDRVHTMCPGTRDYAVLYDTDSDTDVGVTEYNRLFPPGSIGYAPLCVYVGTKTFDENVDENGMARDEDCVWLAFQALHEGAHVWQHCHGFMQEDPDIRMRMAAMDSLAERWLPEYKNMAYLRNICELQADARAARLIKGVFGNLAKDVDPAFADVDVDGIVLEKERGRRGKQILGLHRCKTAKDASALYDVEIGRCLSLPRFDFVWLNGLDGPYSRELEALCRDDAFVQAIERNSGPAEELSAVCSYIGRRHPAMFNGLACIRDDYCGQTAKGKVSGVFAGVLRMSPRDGPGIVDMDRGYGE